MGGSRRAVVGTSSPERQLAPRGSPAGVGDLLLCLVPAADAMLDGDVWIGRQEMIDSRLQPNGQGMIGWWQSQRAVKALLAAAVAAVVVYAVGDLISGLLYDGYSFRDQAISELTAFGSPVRPLMVAVILLHNSLLVAFGVGLWRAADRTSLRWVGGLIAAIGISGLPTHTVFAMSSRWMEPAVNDTMHQLFTGLFLLLVVPAIVAAAVAYRGWFRIYSIATLVVLMAFGAAASFAIGGIEEDSTAWAGGFERVNAYAYLAWLVVLAVTVMRRSLGSAITESDGGRVSRRSAIA
jgi:hypothetical protein